MKYVIGICAFILVFFTLGCSFEKEDNKITTAFLTGAYVHEFHELNLGGQGLTQVPDFERYLTGSYKYDVWAINMQNNNISEVDLKRFLYFPNLQAINLSYNAINSFKGESLPVSKLLLHKNQLQSIDLENYNKLKDLNLGYNIFTSGKDIKLPKDIKILELQHNTLGDIEGIGDLEFLETLKLEFNQLEDEDMIEIKELKNIKNISVAKNKLSQSLEKGFLKFNEANEK